jgi:membrane protease YdiL (CAAX protease family)
MDRNSHKKIHMITRNQQNLNTFDTTDKVQNTGNLPEIIVILFTAIISVLTFIPSVKNLADKTSFLMSIYSYFRIILPLTLLQGIILMKKLSSKLSLVLNFLLIIVSSYAASEIIYRAFPVSMPAGVADILDSETINHFENFFLHRLFHIIPLSAGISLFYMYPSGYFRTFLKFGSLMAKTNIIYGKDKFRTWYETVSWFAAWTAAVFLVLSIYTLWQNSFKLQLPAGIIPAFMLYAVWNCFVEETLFRGIFLSVFSKVMNIEHAILIQAFLFGVVHIDPSDARLSIIKIILFTFLGWFFGRASKETGGIGASFIMHTLLVAGIEMRLLL